MNILVLAGGLSPERNVSLSSGSLISAALRRRGHAVLMLDVYEGVELSGREPLSLFTKEEQGALFVGEVIPDLDELKRRNNNKSELIGDGVLELCGVADLVFIALHGAMGENGQLQATLDNFGIKYTGSGYIGSLLAMDKDISKKMLVHAGVRTPRWKYSSSVEYDADAIIAEVGLPCVVKPASCGSSVGVSFADTKEELIAAFELAARYEDRVLVEEKIVGREFTCGILEGEVLPPVEIIPKVGFYDYKNKYQKGATEEICPADISAEKFSEMADATRRAFDALRLCGYSRFDYIMDSDGALWCLEANTLPGMTPTSLFPQEAAAVGIGYDELCERIAMTALKK